MSEIPNPLLVGREEERSQLGFAVDDVLGGSGGLVVLEAARGMGKSALVSEMARRCADQGILFAGASAADSREGRPFDVLDLALSEFLSDGVRVEALGERLKGLRCPLPLPVRGLAGIVAGSADARDVSPDDPCGGRSWTFWARLHLLARLVQALGSSGPFVLAIDDVDRGDAGLLDLVEYLLIELRRLPLLLVLARRVDEPEASGREARATARLDRLLDRALRYEVRLLRLKLGPLTERQQRDLVSSRHPENHFSESLHHLLAARSRGNPRILLEVLDLLRSRGCIHREPDGGWANLEVAGFPVPDRVEDMLLSRFVDLPEDDFDVLEFLATGGPRLPVVVLQDARVSAHVGTSPRGLLKKMERFVERVPLYRVVGDSFVCRYPLALEAIVGEIPSWVRTVDHRLWAQVGGDVASGAEALVGRARHVLAAGDVESAFALCREAARALAAEGSPGEGLVLLDELAAGLGRSGPEAASLERTVDLHLQRAALMALRGDHDEALATHLRVRPMCAALDREDDEVRSILGQAWCQRMLCRWDQALESCIDAAEAAEAAGVPSLQQRAEVERARVLADLERWDDAFDVVAGAAAAEVGDESGAGVDAALLLAELQLQRGNGRAAERGLMALREGGGPSSLPVRLDVEILRARLGIGGDEADSARASLRRVAETAAAEGYVNGLARATEVLGLSLVASEPEAAAGCLAEAYFLYQRLRHRPAMVRVGREAARLHREREQHRQALFFLEETVNLLKGACEGSLLARLCGEAGQIGLGLSKLYEAQQRFEESIRLHLAAGEAEEAAERRLDLAAVFAAQHKKEKARETLDEAGAAFERLGHEEGARRVEVRRKELEG